MSTTSNALAFARANNNIITSAGARSGEYSRETLRRLTSSGDLEHVDRGIYVVSGTWEDDFFVYQARFARGIYFGNTALYLHGMTDRAPLTPQMMFPFGYNATKLSDYPIKVSRAKQSFYELGVATAKTPSGNIVRTYDIERTLCDILRPRIGEEIQIVSNAFKIYAGMRGKNLHNLTEYARTLGVSQTVRRYMEVLL